MKTKIIYTLCMSMVFGVMVSYTTLSAQPLCPSQNGNRISLKMVHFREDMRMLWEDHIMYTRNVIFNIIDDLPGTNEAIGRLLQNQVDIGNAVRPYYGNSAADQLINLLVDHITIAADLLIALKNNDIPALDLANQQWQDNADEIALFLSSANPHWDFMELQHMLYEHLTLTANEAVARQTQDYAGDIVAYDDVHRSILEMADMLSCGIMSQFPSQFRGNNRESNVNVTLTDSEIELSQNVPNPFTDQTVISWFLPENVHSAQIVFFSGNGALLKTVVLEERGEGTVTVNALNLRNGTYSYSIIADGKVIDTKKMIH